MSAFMDDHAENLKNVEYAYEYGRSERELEIIKLLEEAKPLQATDELEWGIDVAIALIKGENK